MSSSSDERLRRVFVAARAGRPAPPFERLVAPRPRRRRWPRLLPAAAAALLAVLVAVPLERARREREAVRFAVELAAWRAPTDRLLASGTQPEGTGTLFRGLGEPSVLESTNEMVRWRN